MSVCSLKIILDKEPHCFHPGDTVTGHLVVVPYQDVDAKELKIVFRWKTHGSGNVDSETIDTIAFDPPSWAPNEKQEIPFTFQLPQSPLSHSGSLVNVEWVIEAGLNRGWFKNDHVEQSILVVPNPPRTAEIPTQRPVETVASTPLKNGWIIPCAFLFSPISWLIVVNFTDLFAWRTDETASITPFAIFTIIEILSFFIGLFLFLRWWSRSRKIGSVDILVREGSQRLSTEGALNGVSIELTHRPAAALNVTHVDMYLSYRERAWSGAGTNRTSETADKRICTERVGSALTLLPGQLFKEKALLSFPEEPASSFKSTDNEVAWIAGVEFEIEGFPTLRYEQGLWIH